MMSHLCNRRVREFLILTRTWFAFGLPSTTGCDNPSPHFAQLRPLSRSAHAASRRLRPALAFPAIQLAGDRSKPLRAPPRG
jgi:hypothetical protein